MQNVNNLTFAVSNTLALQSEAKKKKKKKSKDRNEDEVDGPNNGSASLAEIQHNTNFALKSSDAPTKLTAADWPLLLKVCVNVKYHFYFLLCIHTYAMLRFSRLVRIEL